MPNPAQAKRAPLKFDINRSPATETEIAKSSPSVASPPAVKSATPDADRKQVGARIPALLYRQLKSRAALEGETVQTLVEQAIAHFLEQPTIHQNNKAMI